MEQDHLEQQWMAAGKNPKILAQIEADPERAQEIIDELDPGDVLPLDADDEEPTAASIAPPIHRMNPDHSGLVRMDFSTFAPSGDERDDSKWQAQAAARREDVQREREKEERARAVATQRGYLKEMDPQTIASLLEASDQLESLYADLAAARGLPIPDEHAPLDEMYNTVYKLQESGALSPGEARQAHKFLNGVEAYDRQFRAAMRGVDEQDNATIFSIENAPWMQDHS